jgi:glycosyltransferase involved in cell wall biosynthesis
MIRHPIFAARRPVVACLDAVGHLGEKLREEGYPVYFKNRKSGLDWRVIPWLRDIIRHEKIDVVHAHQYTPLFYTVPAAILSGRKKVVYTEHGRFYPDRKSWKRKIVNPILAHGVDHLVSISQATAEAMATYDNLPRRRIKVIHNGIDLEKLNPPVDLAAKRREFGISEDSHVLGTAARLEEIKNLPMMLRVFKHVSMQRPDTVLLIAGEGSQTGKLKEMAAEFGIAEKVRFVGLRFDLSEIYKLMDVFLLTSFTEGISVTLLEAMASGVPAVVTDVGGNTEVVVIGETGYVVPLDDDEAMVGKILRLLRDPELAKSFGACAQQRAKERFSFSGMISGYEGCYRS